MRRETCEHKYDYDHDCDGVRNCLKCGQASDNRCPAFITFQGDFDYDCSIQCQMSKGHAMPHVNAGHFGKRPYYIEFGYETFDEADG